MRGIEIFQKPSYREIRPMRDRPMRGPPVLIKFHYIDTSLCNMHEEYVDR